MATINKVEKLVNLDKKHIIRFQLLTYVFLKGDSLHHAELECLAQLAESGAQVLSHFCRMVQGNDIYASSQSARNALTRLEKKGYLVRKGRRRKILALNPEIRVQTEGNILLDFKFAHVPA